MNLYKVFVDEGRRKKFAESVILSQSTSVTIDCKSCNISWVDSSYERPLEIIFTNNHLPDYSKVMPIVFVSEKLKNVLENYSLANCTFEKVYTNTLKDLNEEQIKELKFDGIKVNKICNEKSNYYAIHLLPGISIHPDMNVVFNRCQNCGRLEISKKYDDGKGEFVLDLLLDSSTWEGFELFTVKEFPNRFVCTENFIEICKKAKITGFDFEEI